MLPEVRRLVEQQDREFKQKQRENAEYRRQQLNEREKLRAREEAKIEARIKSATEFEKRHKRAKEHEALLARDRELAAEEKHFEEKVKPKAKKIVYNMKKILYPEAVKADHAFLGARQSYSIKPTERNMYSYSNFLNNSKRELTRVLHEKVTEMRGLKFKLSYLGNFHRGTLLRATPKISKNFRSEVFEVVSQHEINDAVKNAINDIGEEINTFVQHGSGWIFDSNIKLDLNIYHYNPIRGSSYIPLPKIIANKKACINVRNNDDKCFLYSVIAHQHPQTKNAERVTKYEPYVNEYASWKHEYPMKLSNIPKFEEQFKLSIMVYGYKLEFDKESHKQILSFSPLYRTPNIVSDFENVISLLLIQEGEKTHYVLIKSISALMRGSYNDNAAHLCPCCFKPYRSKEKLASHLQNGCAKFGVRAICPTVEKSKELVRFSKIHKMLPKPFVIYADFEAILQAYNDQRNVASNQYQKHVPCGFAFKRVSTVAKYDKDIVTFRGDGTEDVGQHFVNALMKEADEIIKIMNKVVPIMNKKLAFRLHVTVTSVVLD